METRVHEQRITLPEIIEVIEAVTSFPGKKILKVYTEEVKIPSRREAKER